jgi:hypothetical protein
VLDQPFYFVGDELIKELNLDKKSLGSISLKPNQNLLNGERGDLGSMDITTSTNLNHLTDYTFVKNDVFSGID